MERARLGAEDVVLEIGPGRGILTRALAAAAGAVVAIELDRGLADAVARDVPANVRVEQGDAVTAPWPRFTACVSNLPYEVSSPVLFRLLEEGPALGMTRALLMVQKEFADRLVARPDTSDYGRLTVMRELRADAEIVERVPPGAFDPPPKVDSAIVRLVPRAPPFPVPDAAIFAAVVHAAFTQRRKTLANALRNAAHLLPSRARLDALPYAGQRPGELSAAQFAEVAAAIAPGPR